MSLRFATTKTKLGTVCFIIITYWVCAYILNESFYDDYLPTGYMMMFGHALCWFWLILSASTKKVRNIRLIAAIFLLSLIIFSSFNSKLINIIDMGIIIVTMDKKDARAIIERVSIIQILLIVFIAASSMIGIVRHETFVRGDVASFERNSLGFKYASYYPNFLFHAIIALIPSRYEGKKVSLLLLLILNVLNYIGYHYTQTKSAFAFTAGALLLFFLCRFFKKRSSDKKLLKLATTIMFPVAAIASIILPYYYNWNNLKWRGLNTILSGRLSLGQDALSQYPPGLFGQIIQWKTAMNGHTNSSEYFYVDSSYLNILLTYGILIFAVIIILFLLYTRYAVNSNNYLLLVSLICLCLHSIWDPQLLELGYNTLLIGLCCYGISWNKEELRIIQIMAELKK